MTPARKVLATARGFAAQGVSQSDHVAVWLFGGREGLLTFFAINYLGAVFVPFNTAYKGRLLKHVLRNADARLLVAHRDLIARLADVDTATLTAVVSVARTQTTAAFLLGVMANFLLKQEPGAQDSKHSLRLAFIVPMTEAADALHERFGIDIYTIFNMTEISSPIVSDANPTRRGVCGKPRAGVDVRLVDEHDSAAPRGRHRGHLGPRGRGPARQARGVRRLNQPRFFSRRWRQDASWRW